MLDLVKVGDVGVVAVTTDDKQPKEIILPNQNRPTSSFLQLNHPNTLKSSNIQVT